MEKYALIEDCNLVFKTECQTKGDNGEAATVANDQDLEEEADSSFDLFRDGEDGLTDEYSYDYDDYVDETTWGDEDWAEAQHPKPEDFVNIDSHILCTPVSPLLRFDSSVNQSKSLFLAILLF